MRGGPSEFYRFKGLMETEFPNTSSKNLIQLKEEIGSSVIAGDFNAPFLPILALEKLLNLLGTYFAHLYGGDNAVLRRFLELWGRSRRGRT